MSVDGVLYRHWKQRAEKAEAERDALQDQLDALLANGPEPRVWLEYRREAKAMRDIVERAARMGLCSQTGHEHLMAAARAALTPPAPAASVPMGCWQHDWCGLPYGHDGPCNADPAPAASGQRCGYPGCGMPRDVTQHAPGHDHEPESNGRHRFRQPAEPEGGAA